MKKIVLAFNLQNGKAIGLGPAVDWTVTHDENGSTQLSGRNAKGYVVYRADEMKGPVRLYSPQLYDWITGGWKTAFGLRPLVG